jgi:hypothetical protein
VTRPKRTHVRPSDKCLRGLSDTATPAATFVGKPDTAKCNSFYPRRTSCPDTREVTPLLFPASGGGSKEKNQPFSDSSLALLRRCQTFMRHSAARSRNS